MCGVRQRNRVCIPRDFDSFDFLARKTCFFMVSGYFRAQNLKFSYFQLFANSKSPELLASDLPTSAPASAKVNSTALENPRPNIPSHSLWVPDLGCFGAVFDIPEKDFTIRNCSIWRPKVAPRSRGSDGPRGSSGRGGARSPRPLEQ